jgi:hypothetical protein
MIPRPPATWDCAMVVAFRVGERLADRNDINAPADKIALVTKQQATEGINFEVVDEPDKGPAHLDMPENENVTASCRNQQPEDFALFVREIGLDNFFPCAKCNAVVELDNQPVKNALISKRGCCGKKIILARRRYS